MLFAFSLIIIIITTRLVNSFPFKCHNINSLSKIILPRRSINGDITKEYPNTKRYCMKNDNNMIFENDFSNVDQDLNLTTIKAFEGSNKPIIPIDTKGYSYKILNDKNQCIKDFIQLFKNKKDKNVENNFPNQIRSIQLQESISYVLPKEVMWPFFLSNKQINANGPDVICIKDDSYNIKRRKSMMEVMKETPRKLAVLLGATGIGKSIELNYFALHYISNIGKPDMPSIVLIRIPRLGIIEVCLKRKEIQYKLHEVCKSCSDEINSFTEEYYDRNAILLYDAGEGRNEEHQIEPAVPTIISLSLEDVMSRALKTMDKAGSCRYYLFDPPTEKQMREQFETIKNYSSFINECDKLTIEEIDARMKVVGCIPRIVFGSKVCYTKWKYSMTRLGGVERFLNSLINVRDDNIPYYAQSFIAPYFNKEIKSPELYQSNLNTYDFRFLSHYACYLVASKLIPESEHLRRMINFDYYPQMARLMMFHSLRENPWDNLPFFDKEFKKLFQPLSRNKWEVCHDPGTNNVLSKESLLSDASGYIKGNHGLPFPTTPDIMYPSQYYSGDISDLVPSCLYMSHIHTSVLSDGFMVNHKEKRIFFFLAATKDMNEHPIYCSTLFDVMNKLHMFETKNQDYKVEIVFFVDWSRSITHGSMFRLERGRYDGYDLSDLKTIPNIFVYQRKQDSSSSIDIDANHMKARMDEESVNPEELSVLSSTGNFLTRVNTTMIRLPYYPNDPKERLLKLNISQGN